MFFKLKKTFILSSLLISCCSCEKLNYKKEELTYDIIIVAGQSNTCYGYGYDKTSMIKSNVLELGRNNKDMLIIPATPSLNNWSKDSLKSSFGYDFARFYSNRTALNKNPVLIIACGEAGSSFIDNRWNKGNPLYNDLINRTTFILNEYPGSKVVCFLWQQGESDLENTYYQKNLDDMILNMRIDLKQNNLPFFLGGMVPYWTSLSLQRINHQKIIKNTEKRMNQCFYVDPTGISKPDNNFDAIHYSDVNQQILAKKYWKSFITRYCEK